MADTYGGGEGAQGSEVQTATRQTEKTEGGEVNPLLLPYVLMSELRYLPVFSGIYFAIEDSGKVAYIGQGVNIKQRWRAHHVQGDLCDLSDLHSARRIRVAWLRVDRVELDRLEAELIRRFKPRLNVKYIQPEKPKPEPRPSRIVSVQHLGAKGKRTEKMLSVKEAAVRIGAAASSVRYWLTKGRFPRAQLVEPEHGVSYWLIPESDVDGFEIGKPGPKPGTKKKGKAK